MKTISAFVFCVGLLARSLVAAPYDEGQPHGRFCIAVSDAAGKEDAFRPTDAPAAGKKISAYLDASAKCTALVVALRKDGKLAYGWKPQIVDLEEDAETQLPKSPATWEWNAAAGPFDFYVIFLAPGADAAGELKKLVTAIQGTDDDRLLTMQTNKLRELLGRVAAEKDRAAQAVSEESEVGGVFRAIDRDLPRDTTFPWRQFAKGVNFAPDKPGVAIVAVAAGS
jgi:hypothetical protein